MEKAGDIANAFHFYEALARGRDPDAMLRLGQLYERGTPGGEVRADRQQAMKWYCEARGYRHLPRRVEKSLDCPPASQTVPASAATGDWHMTRAEIECRVFRDRWEEACWAKDGSYLYQSSEQCATTAARMKDACWP